MDFLFVPINCLNANAAHRNAGDWRSKSRWRPLWKRRSQLASSLPTNWRSHRTASSQSWVRFPLGRSQNYVLSPQFNPLLFRLSSKACVTHFAMVFVAFHHTHSALKWNKLKVGVNSSFEQGAQWRCFSSIFRDCQLCKVRFGYNRVPHLLSIVGGHGWWLRQKTVRHEKDGYVGGGEQSLVDFK